MRFHPHFKNEDGILPIEIGKSGKNVFQQV